MARESAPTPEMVADAINSMIDSNTERDRIHTELAKLREGEDGVLDVFEVVT